VKEHEKASQALITAHASEIILKAVAVRRRNRGRGGEREMERESARERERVDRRQVQETR